MIHEGRQPQVLEESIVSDASASPDDFRQGYRNRFQATPWEAFFRPPPTPPKPRILGTQSAGGDRPEGRGIHCDRYGRVKVQFHWDREGQADDSSSCWLRVASGWAGRNYGAIAIPRVGMEVLVTFLEGDPDQPLVTGCLFHREHPVPYELPGHKSRSVFKSLSSPGGGGYNELRIEDRKGQEQIFVHAQRDWDENIEHDQKIRVGHQRHDTVQANSYSEFKAEEHRTTHAERKVEVRASDHLTVANDQHLKIASGQFVEAGQEIHLSSGLKVVLGGRRRTDPQGRRQLPQARRQRRDPLRANVRVNSGGSPGNGSGAAPLLPGPLRQADADNPGDLLIARSVRHCCRRNRSAPSAKRPGRKPMRTEPMLPALPADLPWTLNAYLLLDGRQRHGTARASSTNGAILRPSSRCTATAAGRNCWTCRPAWSPSTAARTISCRRSSTTPHRNGATCSSPGSACRSCRSTCGTFCASNLPMASRCCCAWPTRQ